MNLSQFFDTASTTPCSKRAARALDDAASDCFANPSSAHKLGRQALARVTAARAQIASACETTPESVVFTGGGTESDSLAIQGVALAAWFKQRAAAPTPILPLRVISSPVEHAAVRKSIASLGDFGIEVCWVTTDRQGRVDLPSLKSLLAPQTCLVSIQCVNNILGTVQPIAEIAALVREYAPQAVFHSDAVQAFGKLPLPTWSSGPDLLSISAHKIYGPKGVGALVAREPRLLSRDQLRPLIFGGDQEFGLRSGTVSPGLTAAFGEAAQEACSQQEANLHTVTALAQLLREGISSKTGLNWNSSPQGPEQSPYIHNLDLGSVPGATLSQWLEEKGFITSTMSACSSKNQTVDPTLLATGRTEQEASAALRISLSPSHTPADVENFVEAFCATYSEARRLLS